VRAEGKETVFIVDAVCVLYEVRAETEEIVEHRASNIQYRTWQIVNVEDRSLRDIECIFPPIRYLDIINLD